MSRTMTVQDSVVVDADPMTDLPADRRPEPDAALEPGEHRRRRSRARARLPPSAPRSSAPTSAGSLGGRPAAASRLSDPGERFAFDVFQFGLSTPVVRFRIATWAYEFEAVEGGTKVTETWTDGRRRWPDAMANTVDKLATGGRTFADFQRRNIAKTLANLKADLES